MNMKTSATPPHALVDQTLVRWLQFLRDDVAALNAEVKRLTEELEALRKTVETK
jgi:hypothetical protein